MEVLEVPGRPRVWALAAAAVACLLLIAATYKVTFDVLRWRDEVQNARIVGQDPANGEQIRTQAIVVMHRDAQASLQVLRQLLLEGGPCAKQAGLALAAIAREAGR